MRHIKMYRTPAGTSPLPGFLRSIGDKLAEKVVRQILLAADTPPALWREPHIKHFSLEKYSSLYELREKNKVLIRIVFTIHDGDILLLAPFIKHCTRDTMKALELSLRMLSDVQIHPENAVDFAMQSHSKNGLADGTV